MFIFGIERYASRGFLTILQSLYTYRGIATNGVKMMEELYFKNACNNGHAAVGFNTEDCPVCEEMTLSANFADEANRLARERDDGWRD